MAPSYTKTQTTGRAGHHGSPSVRGTQVAAIVYTAMETAKRNGLDRHQWIVDAIYRRKLGPPAIPLPLAYHGLLRARFRPFVETQHGKWVQREG